jgi:hypothetical protein
VYSTVNNVRCVSDKITTVLICMKQYSLALSSKFPWFMCQEHRSTFPLTNKLSWITASSQEETKQLSCPARQQTEIAYTYTASVYLSHWFRIGFVFYAFYSVIYNAKQLMNLYLTETLLPRLFNDSLSTTAVTHFRMTGLIWVTSMTFWQGFSLKYAILKHLKCVFIVTFS